MESSSKYEMAARANRQFPPALDGVSYTNGKTATRPTSDTEVLAAENPVAIDGVRNSKLVTDPIPALA